MFYIKVSLVTLIISNIIPQLMAANEQIENTGDYSIESRSKINNQHKNNKKYYSSPNAMMMTDRSFGFKFLGFNALANYLRNSVSYTTTSTSYSTIYSALTIGRVATCYTSTLFADPVEGCTRKKREFPSSLAGLIVGDEYNTQEGINNPINPSLVQGYKTLQM